MRGAADTSRDGKITLDEAYGWAWARTIEATFSTRGGVQRPAYSVDLRGSGQLVIAEPARATSRLTLDVKPAGHWLIVADANKQLVADVEKGEGPMTLAVAPGSYRVQLRTSDSVLERTVEVPASGGAVVSGADLERASLLRVARKGGEEVRLHLSAGAGAASGLVLGLSQTLRGAHYPSHTAWTTLVCAATAWSRLAAWRRRASSRWLRPLRSSACARLNKPACRLPMPTAT
jgi:hypothetical protein